ncbi:dienelactone hydrolase family protein [Nostoc sp. FACHB-888]|uniref:dienelactone hydrolase family protein n=1 Tax=Nostoc sp. FACHB-888 TaxID=2692842 RepID=UPI0016858A47|nr:dienelactone hydrolase family protein [Nostoc sp. FACHB-888]MBD2248352.1 dienelactone hydrolase family protein [Nostoc sp. FACHB-888]
MFLGTGRVGSVGFCMGGKLAYPQPAVNFNKCEVKGDKGINYMRSLASLYLFA